MKNLSLSSKINGNAHVIVEHGNLVLFSYNTKIMVQDVYGNFYRIWDGWTNTTGKHIKAFSGLNKEGYFNLKSF